MKIIVGVIVENNGKILMIKEKKKKVYGKWNIPGGNLKEKENIFLAAEREFKEETGFDVKLLKIISIYNKVSSNQSVITIRFFGKIIGGKINFNKEEILNVEWIPIELIKTFEKEKIRNYEMMIDTIKKIEHNIYYPLDIIKNVE